jgi:hypothetical protein
MLPESRNVGEPEIDHLDLVVFDCFEEIVRALAFVMHLRLPSTKVAEHPMLAWASEAS